MPDDPRYAEFPSDFFQRVDESTDEQFYGTPRLVTHIDDGAIDAVGALYEQLALHDGDVLDLMSSWVSHFRKAPKSLTVLGMNEFELDRNTMATQRVFQDLNVNPGLPFDADQFDAVTCVVSIDYLTRPIEVLEDVRRVVRPGGRVVITFSNRCFPTKAIRGWLMSGNRDHCRIVERYLELAGGWLDITSEQRPTSERDPLFAVVARRD